MFDPMNLDEVTLVLDIGATSNDSLSRWFELVFNNDDGHPIMTANLTVRYDDFDLACASMRVDPFEARTSAFVKVQSSHFGDKGRMATEVAWVKVKKNDTATILTLYHLHHDNRAVVVYEDAQGDFGEVFESRGDAAHAFNAAIAKANT